MSKLLYRPATLEDFPACQALEHRYQTARIWQMTLSQQADTIRVHFQTTRLPQSATIAYPYDAEALSKRWWEAHWFLVGEMDEQIQAYVTATQEALRPITWVGDLVVDSRLRRKGHGSELLTAAGAWARQEGSRFLMTAVPMKNDPAMQFLRRNGFQFCGYNEAQFQARDIDLYFSLKL